MNLRRWTVWLMFAAAAVLLVACGRLEEDPGTVLGPTLANPASENCVAQGGELRIEKRGDGGEFGVCFFEDNLQCEEWAMMRGECPVGGVRVTGYATEAGRYCAITGGEYAVAGSDEAGGEIGTCTLPDASVCDATDYYNDLCPATE